MRIKIFPVQRQCFAVILPLLFAVLFPAPSRSQTSAIAGEFRIDPPTLTALGFEWRITGDDNRNARVEAAYRKRGEREWRKALPFLRLQHEAVTNGGPGARRNWWYSYEAPNMFAGSILNLEAGTEYECQFDFSDPDGVKGEAKKTVTVRTREEPQPAQGGRVYHVYPFGYQGARQEPAFTGLLAAYYMGADNSDHNNVMPARVEPGDIILLHAGLYKDRRFVYGGFDRSIPTLGTPFDGTYYLTQSGTASKADRHKGGRRWGGHLRWRRLPQPVQSAGGQLQLLRRHHDSQHQRGVSRRAKEHRRG